MKQNLFKKNKGAALYLTLMIMTVLLTVSFGLNTILYSQINIGKEIGNSVIALYAADTGIERYLRGACPFTGSDEILLDNNSSYKITICTPSSLDFSCCIQSIGAYQKTQRAIKVEY